VLAAAVVLLVAGGVAGKYLTLPGYHPLDGPDLDLRLAIAPHKVTLHAICNLAFIDEVMPMPRADEYALAAHEQAALRASMVPWLALNHEVRIDGVVVPPALAGFTVDPGDPRWLPMFPIMGAKALIKVHFELEYHAEDPPRTVSLVWRAYPPDLLRSTPRATITNDVVALVTAGADEQVVTLRSHAPEFTWHAPEGDANPRLLAVPPPPRATRAPSANWALSGLAAAVIAFVFAAVRAPGLRRARPWLAAAAILAVALSYRSLAPLLFGRLELPTVEQAAAIFTPLHANVYRAFDATEPAEVYDTLARSVDGTLLDTIYHDIYRSLVMAEEGGAVSRVKAVRPLATDVEHIGVLDDGRTVSFTVHARWQVDGAVFHWGHQHWRTNEHRARYTVVATDAGWRIAGAQALAQERIDAGTGFLPPLRAAQTVPAEAGK
jgi:hypothetical protein